MRKKSIMMLALAAITTSVAVHAETTETAASAVEASAVKLSADELAFAAKLSDQNRKSFAEKLSADQRKSVQIAVKHGANADEAVQKMMAAASLKEGSAVANVASEATTSTAK